MKTHTRLTPILGSIAFTTLLACLSTLNSQLSASPLGTAFTYQGRLASGANAANGSFDLKFTLYDALSSGSVMAGPLTNAATSVTNGYFTVALDFGGVFDGNARWLEIGVRTNGSGAFTTLTPRQLLSAAPYAVYAPSAGAAATATIAASANSVAAVNVTGTLALGQLPGAVVTNNATGVTLVGTFTGSGSGLSSVNADLVDGQHGAFYQNAANLTAGTLADARLSANVPLLTANQVFSGSNRFAGVATLTNAANTFAGAFTGNGAGLTNLNASQLAAGTLPLALLPGAVVTNNATGLNLSGTFSGNGAAVTNVNLMSVTSQGALGWATNWGGLVAASSPDAGNQPVCVVAADMNGDGKMDLISANYSDNTLTVLTNNGSGGFVLAVSQAVLSNPTSVAAADVNGDGKMDLICVNSGSFTLLVLTNNGHGGFVFSSMPPGGSGPVAVATADVNGDGKPDLITAGSAGNTLTVVTNNGSGRFAASATLYVVSDPEEVTAADINGDGKVDLVSAHPEVDLLTVLTNTGSGAFAEAAILQVGTAPGTAPYCVAAADVNGDGLMDLISANGGTNTLSVLTNNGHGGFGLASSPAVGDGPRWVAAADVNDDGRPDLISANFSGGIGNTLTVLTNNGSGRFAVALSPSVGLGPRCIAAADVNGDGRPDVISANQSDSTLTVLFNTISYQASFAGDGAALTGLNAANLTGTAGSLSVTNINVLGAIAGNGAGVTNVSLVSLNSQGAIGWTTNWGNFILASSPGAGADPVAFTAADVNGDGKVDLISANLIASTLSVLTNNGSGGFVLASSPAVGTYPVSVTAADVNGDGRLDLISANDGPDNLSVLTNNGSSSFVLASSPTVGTSPSSVTAADVNGDGKMDLISANMAANTLSVLTNNGSGGFVLASSPGVGPSPQSVTAADVNGDGKVDLISANGGANTLSVLTNNGTGGFVLSSSPEVGVFPTWVTAADVNGDGRLDLISANDFPNTLSVLTNNGSGGFVLSTSPGVGDSPYGVVAADVNGDGSLDLISANFDANTLSVLTNNGRGGFVLAGSPAVGDRPNSVAAADVNGDGKLDLICANGSDDTLSVLFNVPMGYGGVFRGSFSGDGSGLNNLDATDLTGTVADARLSTNVALLNANQAYTGANRFVGAVTLTNTGNLLSGTGTFSGNGGGLTNLDATDLTGTVADARLSANVAWLNTNQAFTGSNRFAGVVTLTNAANTLAGTFTGNGGGLTNLNASQLTSGTLPLAQLPLATVTNNETGVTLTGTFTGNGGGLTNLNASQLASGTLADARLSTNVALLNGSQAFMAANRFAGAVMLTNAANTIAGTFTGNAGGLTNLDASDLTGTVSDTRLSANVVLLNGNQAMTGTNRFAGVVVATNDNNQLAGTLYGSPPYLKFAEVTANVSAGSAVAGTNNWREFNVELTDTHNLGSTNGAGDMVLPAGTYQCRISAPAFRVETHQIRLRTSTGTNLLFGTIGYSDSSTGGSEDRSQIDGQFTLAATTTLRVQHWCTLANADDGLGFLQSFNWGDTNQTIFAVAEFWKIK